MLPGVVLCPTPREEMSTRRRRRRRGKEGGAEGEGLIASGAECLSRQPAPPPGDSRTQALPPLPHKRVSSLPRDPTAQSKRAKATCCPQLLQRSLRSRPCHQGIRDKEELDEEERWRRFSWSALQLRNWSSVHGSKRAMCLFGKSITPQVRCSARSDGAREFHGVAAKHLQVASER